MSPEVPQARRALGAQLGGISSWGGPRRVRGIPQIEKSQLGVYRERHEPRTKCHRFFKTGGRKEVAKGTLWLYCGH